MSLKGAVECKRIKTGLADKLFVLIIILLQYRCERDAEVQLQPLQQVNGVDKNNLFKVSLPCMYICVVVNFLSAVILFFFCFWVC